MPERPWPRTTCPSVALAPDPAGEMEGWARPEHRLTRLQSAYYGAFILALVLCWAPSKLLGYLAPGLVLALLLIGGRNSLVVQRTCLISAAFASFILGHWLFRDGFVLQGAVLGLLTYSGLWLLAVIPSAQLANPALCNKLRRAACVVVVVEGLIGIAQGAYGYFASGTFDFSNGDIVHGTIDLRFAPDGAFANPIFAANMSLLLLCLAPYLTRRRGQVYPFLIGVCALILSSVIHQLLFLGVAVVVAAAACRPRIPRLSGRLLLCALLLAGGLLSFLLLPRNLLSASSIAREFTAGRSPRSEVLVRTASTLPAEDPLAILFGVGLGQFSSRAALMSSGYFFGGPLSPRQELPFTPEVPGPLEQYVMDLWLKSAANMFYGSSQQPFFSWLSLLVEMGGFVGVGLLGVVAIALIRLRSPARRPGLRLACCCVAAGILFICLLGLQENYWEVPQAILCGCLWLKVQYGLCVYGRVRVG